MEIIRSLNDIKNENDFPNKLEWKSYVTNMIKLNINHMYSLHQEINEFKIINDKLKEIINSWSGDNDNDKIFINNEITVDEENINDDAKKTKKSKKTEEINEIEKPKIKKTTKKLEDIVEEVEKPKTKKTTKKTEDIIEEEVEKPKTKKTTKKTEDIIEEVEKPKTKKTTKKTEDIIEEEIEKTKKTTKKN
jgi:hypothetical protein